MSHYMEWSKKIYKIYLKYVSPEDIHVYSIDEVFMDITKYLSTSKMTPKEFAAQILKDIYHSTGLTATAGIGTNLYLSKIAMDIGAKHINSEKNDLRIALLDEKRYRQFLWNHRPITDFWRVGKGYAKKLEKEGLYTMGDIAKCSVGADDEYYNEKLLYDLFGVNAELLIDHAWGYEPCTMQDIKRYKPERNSIGTGQVLSCPYNFEKTKLIVKEMLDLLALDLVGKSLVTNQIVLTIGYDKDNDYDNDSITVLQSKMTYGADSPYAGLGLDEDTTVDAGDYLAIYEAGDNQIQYALITSVSSDNADYVIAYTKVTWDEVQAAMDVYQTDNIKGESIL